MADAAATVPAPKPKSPVPPTREPRKRTRSPPPASPKGRSRRELPTHAVEILKASHANYPYPKKKRRHNSTGPPCQHTTEAYPKTPLPAYRATSSQGGGPTGGRGGPDGGCGGFGRRRRSKDVAHCAPAACASHTRRTRTARACERRHWLRGRERLERRARGQYANLCGPSGAESVPSALTVVAATITHSSASARERYEPLLASRGLPDAAPARHRSGRDFARPLFLRLDSMSQAMHDHFI